MKLTRKEREFFEGLAAAMIKDFKRVWPQYYKLAMRVFQNLQRVDRKVKGKPIMIKHKLFKKREEK